MGRSTELATRAALATAGVLAGELAWAVARRVPAFTDLDASGFEGREGAPSLTLAVLGDSSCTGPGLHDPSQIWVRELARMLGDSFRISVVSFAVGGSVAGDVVRTQLPEAALLQPDIAMVSVGANDALRGVSLKTFRRHLDTIAGTLSASADLVVLSGVGDLGSIPRLAPPLENLYRRRGQALNAIHHHVGQRHGVIVADQWAWTAQEFQRRPELFSPDLFHPTAEGHRLWATVAFETLEPHLHRLERG